MTQSWQPNFNKWRDDQDRLARELRSAGIHVRVMVLINALRDEGPSPEYHHMIMSRHREEWPTLWAALDRLVVAYDE